MLAHSPIVVLGMIILPLLMTLTWIQVSVRLPVDSLAPLGTRETPREEIGRRLATGITFYGKLDKRLGTRID